MSIIFTKVEKFIKNITSNNKALFLFNILFAILNIILLIQANKISSEAWKVSEANLGFEIDKRSQEYVSDAYDSLYSKETNFTTMQYLRNNEEVSEIELLKVIDVFEETGSNFCQGTAKARHIKIYLQKSLSYLCDNQLVYDTYAGEKNGLAILCFEFSPESMFAQTLNQENLDTCEFIDSNTFERTDNRKRFEYK